MLSSAWSHLSDVLRVHFSEIANHAKINGASAHTKTVELWCPVTQNWATVAMAQVIRNQLSAQHAKATLHIVPAEDHVLNLPSGSSLTDAYVAARVTNMPNMNNTGRLPSLTLIHNEMELPLKDVVGSPEVVIDSMGAIIGIDFDKDDAGAATSSENVVILQQLPATVIVKLQDVCIGI